MKVKVYAPAFCDHSAIDSDGFVELPEGSKLKDLHRVLKTPFIYRKLVLSSINYETVYFNRKLKDGDTVSFIMPLGGG